MKTGTALSVTCLSVFLMITSLNAFETSPNLNPSVQVAVEDFLVSDSGAVGRKYAPRIAVDGTGGFVITWADERYGNGDIYAQRFNSSGSRIGTNFKVDEGYIGADIPAIAIDKSGNFVITWRDSRNNTNIYAQRYNNSGNPQGRNFKVSDTTAYYTPSVGFDISGNYIIVWGYSLNSKDYNIYEQRYSNTGTAIGGNIIVDTISESYYLSPYFSIYFDKYANFLTLWDNRPSNSSDYGKYPPDVFARMASYSGSPIGNQFKLCNDSLNRWQYFPSAAFDTSGGFVTAWVDEREINYAIYAQRYDKNAAKVGTNFRVTDDMGGFKKYYPKVAVEESGNFIIAWVDDRTGNYNASIYAQRYDKNGTSIGTNFKINGIHPISDTIDNSYSLWCDIKLHNNKIYTTWQSRYSAQKTQLIWANILDWTNPIQISGINNPSYPNSLRCGLAQNYPNPFTTATTIKYSLPKDDHVSLSVYTLAGRNVKQLISGKKCAGGYSAVWDGRNEAGQQVPAGVYVYKLVSGKYQETRRMVVKR